MLERHERIVSTPTGRLATYINEITDSMKMVASLGREREILRVLELQAQAAPKVTRFLVLGCVGLGLGTGVMLGTGALMFYWFSRRLANGAVRGFAQVEISHAENFINDASLGEMCLPFSNPSPSPKWRRPEY